MNQQSEGGELREAKCLRKPMAVLFVFLFIRLIVMVYLPLSDPSECRYGNMAANMAKTGNFIEPQFIHDGEMQCFIGKPPLFFQASAVCSEVLGQNAFAVRLPSLICALLTVWMVFSAVRKTATRKSAWAAALLCFLSPLFYIFSGLCLTDMMLTFCIVGGILSYANFSDVRCRANIKLHSVLFFIFLALGMIVKGPIAIVSIGLPVFIFVAIGKRWGELRNHAWILGSVAFALIALPWFVIMSQRNPEFLKYFFYNENFGRFFLKDYGDKFGNGHDSFRGVALLLSLAVNLPALLPLGRLAVAGRLRLAGLCKNPTECMAIIAAVALTAFWCPTNRVPISYLLPTIPFFAIFAALKTSEAEYMDDVRELRFLSRQAVVWGGITACVLVVATVFCASLTNKMPTAFYRLVRSKMDTDDKLAKTKLYFISRTPYSAEFYLGDRVQNHPDEKLTPSITNSAPYLMVVTDRKLRENDYKPNRELIVRYGGWNLFAPDRKEVQ